MIDFQKELNTEQLAVVLNGDGPCLVLAGAGSGKTRVITYRVAYLLEQGIAPDQILLVTFTNKAAREMTNRIVMLTGRKQGLPWAGTFHHIAFRLLKQYAPLIGYKNQFTILDSEDSVDLMKLCLKQEGIDRTERRFPSAKVMHSLVSYARNAEMSLEAVLEEKHPQWLSVSDVLGRIASAYAQRKREANAMDFDDLLDNLHRLLLKSENVRKKLAEQFLYILVDEYQDTNTKQASIVRLLASHHHNLLVVGDDAQSIYSFRAADVRNILSFEKEYANAKIFRLETNYRSTPEILQVANDIIANNKAQYRKELKSVLPPLVKPEVHAFADTAEEAAFIAERMLEHRDEGVPLQDMAVLFRAAFHSQALEVELAKRNIPYDYRGGVRFFERAHIKDVLAYLRIFYNLEDAIAWSRVLNLQAGIGPAGAEKVMNAIRSQPDPQILPTLGPLLSARGQIGWNDFLRIWHGMARGEDQTPASLITAILDSAYADYLEREYPDYRERREDIEQLARFAERQPDLQQFLAEASLQESFTARQAARTSPGDDDEKVILSTIHQAKGLEWDTVFIMNLAAGQFPSDRSLRERQGLEEERRLFYVAVTRAKKQLYLSYPLVGSFDSMLTGPSLFLEELNRELVDEHSLGGGGTNTVSDGIIYVAEDEPFSDDSKPFDKKPWSKSFLKDVGDL